jgi:peptide/nickel transport system permease protein
MFVFFLRRIGLLVLTLFITSLLIFLIAQVLPGDVCRVILGREAGDAALHTCRMDLGFMDENGEPINSTTRYISWVADFVKGDWGRSFATGEDIKTWVLGRLNNSLMLAVLVIFISIPLATFLGIVAGINEGKWMDSIISIGSLAVVGLPEFVTGILLINLVAFRSNILPATSSIPMGTSFWKALPSLILPATSASLVLLAYIARLTRTGVIYELKQSYVQTAELKGLNRSTILFRHILRNSMLPTITVIALSIGWLVSGLVVVENVFNFPGLGRLMIFAIDRRDLPTLQACVMVSVIGFALANLAADLIYGFLNPRIRFGK